MHLTHITSATNPRLRHAIRLREARYRRRSGQFIVDGIREIYRAIVAGIPLESLFVRRDRWLQSAAADSLKTSVHGSQALPWISSLFADYSEGKLFASQSSPSLNIDQLQCNVVAESGFEKLMYGERAEGVVAVFKTPAYPISLLELPSNPLILVLDRIEKPGNIGAILRSADAAGADAILLVDCGTDLMNPNVIRASCGTVFSPRIAVTELEEAHAWLTSHHIHPLALRVEAEDSLWDYDLRGGVAFLVGNEAEGLGSRWAPETIHGIRLPMLGIADSLNASVTTAICLFEAVRQRHESARDTAIRSL